MLKGNGIVRLDIKKHLGPCCVTMLYRSTYDNETMYVSRFTAISGSSFTRIVPQYRGTDNTLEGGLKEQHPSAFARRLRPSPYVLACAVRSQKLLGVWSPSDRQPCHESYQVSPESRIEVLTRPGKMPTTLPSHLAYLAPVSAETGCTRNNEGAVVR